MTLPATPFRKDHTGNGVATSFLYDWKITSNTHLKVIERVLATGVETVLTLGVHYSVTGVGNDGGGNVVYGVPTPTALPNTKKITILPNVPYEQDTDFTNQNSVLPQEAEDMADKLGRQVKQLAEIASRAVTVPQTSTDTPAQYLLDIEAAKQDALDAAAAAGASESDAETAATAAQTAQGLAEDARDDAITAKNAAETAETNAETAATNANNSANLADADRIAAQSAASDADADRIAAQAAASTATTQAGLASTSAGNAATSETNAAASAVAAADSAAKLTGTSTSSVSIGTGAKTFTTQAGKNFGTGRHVLITSDADAANRRMSGVVTDYTGTSLQVSVEVAVGGPGPYTDWTIRIDGERGQQGNAGTLSFAALPAETAIAINDEVVINDVSEGADAPNKMTIANFLKAFTALTTTALASGDEFPFYDISGAVAGKVTLQNIFNFINSLTAETAPATGDKLAMIDVSASNACDSITLDNLFKIIGSLTSVTAPAIDDLFAIYDTSATAAGRMRLDDMFKVINLLTADGSPDAANDYIVTYDASASAAKKVLLSALGGGVGAVTLQAFTSSGTYTPTSGTKFALIICTAGGGGGGGADSTTNGAETAAAGGTAGGTSIAVVSLVATGITSATITIGAGGTQGGNTGTSGTSGGDSSFVGSDAVTYAYAKGGAFGSGTGNAAAASYLAESNGGTPFTGAVGLIQLMGGYGNVGSTDAAGGNAAGGEGGASFWGGGMRGEIIRGGAKAGSFATGDTNAPPGTGGGGAACTSIGGEQGCVGRSGMIMVLEFK